MCRLIVLFTQASQYAVMKSYTVYKCTEMEWYPLSLSCLLMCAGQLFTSKFCLHLPSFFCAAWKWETTHKWTMQVICISSNVLDSRELPAPWSIQTKCKHLGYIKYMELFQNWLTFINWVEPSQCGKFIPNWQSYYMQHCCPESDVELIAES